jgi:hypothetical protein
MPHDSECHGTDRVSLPSERLERLPNRELCVIDPHGPFAGTSA